MIEKIVYYIRLVACWPILYVGIWMETFGEWLADKGDQIQDLAEDIEGDAPGTGIIFDEVDLSKWPSAPVINDFLQAELHHVNLEQFIQERQGTWPTRYPD